LSFVRLTSLLQSLEEVLVPLLRPSMPSQVPPLPSTPSLSPSRSHFPSSPIPSPISHFPSSAYLLASVHHVAADHAVLDVLDTRPHPLERLLRLLQQRDPHSAHPLLRR